MNYQDTGYKLGGDAIYQNKTGEYMLEKDHRYLVEPTIEELKQIREVVALSRVSGIMGTALYCIKRSTLKMEV